MSHRCCADTRPSSLLLTQVHLALTTAAYVAMRVNIQGLSGSVNRNIEVILSQLARPG